MIKFEAVGEKKNVALITLNRPKALNAFCNQLMTEVCIFIFIILTTVVSKLIVLCALERLSFTLLALVFVRQETERSLPAGRRVFTLARSLCALAQTD